MRIGQIIKGAKAHYELIEFLLERALAPEPFKARILPGTDIPPPAEWAFVKMPPDQRCDYRDSALFSFKRECNAYRHLRIERSPYIREMYDIVENTRSPPCLVLEWMDYSLQDLSSDSHRKNPVLHHAIMKSCLMGLVELKKERLVHMNIKPSNILLSHIDTHRPIVKLGGLGQAREDDYGDDALPFAMHPPELLHNLGYSHQSDVWSLAATLFSWIKPGVFGPRNSRCVADDRCVSIAKLMQLFPEWDDTLDDHQGKLASSRCLVNKIVHYEEDDEEDMKYNGAGDDESNKDNNNNEDEGNKECLGCEVCCRCGKCGEYHSKLQDLLRLDVSGVSCLEEEMRKMDIGPALMNMFRYLFIADSEQRPSAEEALASKQFLALEEAAFARWRD